MEEQVCTLKFNSDCSKVSIEGLCSDFFEIDYSSDIDFTPLVRLLSQKIEEEKKIKLACSDDEQSQTEKEKILFDTLGKVVDSYNRSFNAITHIDTQADSGENPVDSDGLPF